MAQQSDAKPTQANNKSTNSPKASKMHRRSRSGCFTCRLRRKKCSEEKPRCRACRNLGLDCEYKRPVWWTNNESRRKQKDHIKNIIKRTKTNEKSNIQDPSRPPLKHTQSMPTYLEDYNRMGRQSSEESDDYDDDNGLDPVWAGTSTFDPLSQQYTYPPCAHPDMFANGYTYEIDVKTERQMYVNDVPTRRDSSISTFSTFVPPPPHAVLPSYAGDEFLHHSSFDVPSWPPTGDENLDYNFLNFAPDVTTQQAIPQQTSTVNIDLSDDADRPYLDHFLASILPRVYPILELTNRGTVKSDILLPALETNPTYVHACLCNAANDIKCRNLAPPVISMPDGTTTTPSVESYHLTLDQATLNHKFAFISNNVSHLENDSNHHQALESTLGMISLQCLTGGMEKDIPWHQHFQAAIEIIPKLNLTAAFDPIQPQGVRPPFSIALTAWIDILGATMLGRAPIFADAYRNRHLAAAPCGLAELMGCQDNVMYLLSEVACLDALRLEKRLDDIGVCSHVQSLGRQLDATEMPNEVLVHPYSSTGALRPRQLSKNITAIFRKALRLYLCSLVPGYDRYSVACVNLVSQLTEMLQFVPSGPDGFDRSLVWPLLLAGVSSTPTSSFRKVLAERVEALGVANQQGSLGRVVKVLEECWRRNDEVIVSDGVCEATPLTAGAGSPIGGVVATLNENSPFTAGQPTTIMGLGMPHVAKHGDVHWRDVMRENGWEFLLI